MRAMLAIAAVGLAVAAVAPAVAAQGPTRNSVIGSGTSAVCGGPFTIKAESDPDGGNATGQVACGTLFFGPVTCLIVDDNVARLLVNTSQSGFTAGVVTMQITDNGPQGDFVGARDVLAGCPRPLVIGYIDLGFSGDIVVRQAPPPPTSKAQCKQGGWQSFGGFKNQRDCVHFVRHQARLECIFIRAAGGRPAFRARYGSGPHLRHAMRNCVRERTND